MVSRSDFYDITSRLQHYACFSCRKAFKQPFDSSRPERPCPQCGRLMPNMGTDFKAPPQKDIEQWRKVEALALAGVRFFPRWPSELPGERPATLSEVPAFLRQSRPPTPGQRFLERDHSQPLKVPHEGRLEQRGTFPSQTYSLLGQPLESGTALEMFEAGAWRPVQFISRGNGYVPIPQPYVLPRVASMVHLSQAPTFLTPHHRLRWPPT